jgi:hypothetical protein
MRGPLGRQDAKMSAWVNQIFQSNIAKRGGVVRRKLSSIDKYASQREVTKEAKPRGYHIVQHGDQWLIFCDTASVRIIA